MTERIPVDNPDANPVNTEPAVGTATGVGSHRTAGRLQWTTLLLSGCLVVLGAVLLTPIMPTMQDAFAGTPGVKSLVPVVVTVPSLMIGLFSPIAGILVDRIGRKNVMVVALVLYAALGTAPLWLDSLGLILASRAGVGLTEAVIMTAGSALVGDYFNVQQRARYMALSTVFTTISATVLLAVGGALGGFGWRTPFWAYAVALVFAVMVGLFIWQPERPTVTDADAAGSDATRSPFPWRIMAAPAGISLFAGVIFYVPLVELSFKLDSLGIKATAVIGGISAIASAATAVGGASFTKVSGRGHQALLPIGFAAAGLGIVVLGVAPVVPLVAVGAVIASAGSGLLLPTLGTWVINLLSFENRGRGTGLWNASFMIGQFFCPLVVVGLSSLLGGLPAALALLGVASLAAAGGIKLAAVRQGAGPRLVYGA